VAGLGKNPDAPCELDFGTETREAKKEGAWVGAGTAGDLNAEVDTGDGAVSEDLEVADERGALDTALVDAVPGTGVRVPVDEFEVGFCTRRYAEPIP
jgi:hypothetical protein